MESNEKKENRNRYSIPIIFTKQYSSKIDIAKISLLVEFSEILSIEIAKFIYIYFHTSIFYLFMDAKLQLLYCKLYAPKMGKKCNEKCWYQFF